MSEHERTTRLYYYQRTIEHVLPKIQHTTNTQSVKEKDPIAREEDLFLKSEVFNSKDTLHMFTRVSYTYVFLY